MCCHLKWHKLLTKQNKKLETKIIQITSARGPVECQWVVQQLLKVFKAEAKAQQFLVKTINRVEGTADDCLKSVVLEVSGKGVSNFMQDWEGTILWIGNSLFRKFHKRKNWFVGVAVYKVTAKNTIDFKDVTFQTLRASGPGGQHVNKTETAVRAIHQPTGIAVVSKAQRSQAMNKKTAIALLQQKLAQQHSSALKQQESEIWNDQIELTRGNPVRIYKGEKFKQVKK